MILKRSGLCGVVVPRLGEVHNCEDNLRKLSERMRKPKQLSQPVSSPATSQTPYLESEMKLEPEAYELCSLRQQRDAALELADKWEVEAKDTFKSNVVRFA